METINAQTTPNTASEQDTSAAAQRKGGFVQGAAVAQGCCGETSTSSGCCGTPTQAAAPAATVQPSAQAGCCGTTATTPVSGGCCS